VFSFFFFIPGSGKGEQRESFHSGKVVGWDKIVVCISKYTLRVSVYIKNPGLIEREGQFGVPVLVHEF
jgi:hypothetical protein